MQCSDLERYLEAHVDGRLGRAGSSILRRHLMGCATCRGRVARLREFERDVRARLQSTEQVMSLWQGLEREPAALSLLAPRPHEADTPLRRRGDQRTHLPRPVPAIEPPGTVRRTWSLRLAGLAFLGLAAAGVVDTVRSVAGLGTGPEAEDLLKLAEARLGVQPRASALMTTGTSEEVRSWLEGQLGHPLPDLTEPSGYALAEGSVADVRGTPAALLHYQGVSPQAARSVLVLMEPMAAGTVPAAPAPAVASQAADGVREVTWNAHDYHYTALAADTNADLAVFAK
ncbi:MAG: zf-HC2 domain-containing protein [Geminicoccaceae bacterium]